MNTLAQTAHEALESYTRAVHDLATDPGISFYDRVTDIVKLQKPELRCPDYLAHNLDQPTRDEYIGWAHLILAIEPPANTDGEPPQDLPTTTPWNITDIDGVAALTLAVKDTFELPMQSRATPRITNGALRRALNDAPGRITLARFEAPERLAHELALVAGQLHVGFESIHEYIGNDSFRVNAAVSEAVRKNGRSG